MVFTLAGRQLDTISWRLSASLRVSLHTAAWVLRWLRIGLQLTEGWHP
jgi:hypothetical protein